MLGAGKWGVRGGGGGNLHGTLFMTFCHYDFVLHDVAWPAYVHPLSLVLAVTRILELVSDWSGNRLDG